MLTAAVLATGLASGCSMTPSVTKQRMTLAEANITDMKCRRGASTGTSIPKTVCADPAIWAKYDAHNADESDKFIDEARDNVDNRILYGR